MIDKKPFDGTTVKEFPKVGRYRVRVLQQGRNGDLDTVLDIREHMESERYSGFTRRGIRLYDMKDVESLYETCRMILEDKLLAQKKEGSDA